MFCVDKQLVGDHWHHRLINDKARREQQAKAPTGDNKAEQGSASSTRKQKPSLKKAAVKAPQVVLPEECQVQLIQSSTVKEGPQASSHMSRRGGLRTV